VVAWFGWEAPRRPVAMLTPGSARGRYVVPARQPAGGRPALLAPHVARRRPVVPARRPARGRRVVLAPHLVLQ
jgi:hypothetical protein